MSNNDQPANDRDNIAQIVSQSQEAAYQARLETITKWAARELVLHCNYERLGEDLEGKVYHMVDLFLRGNEDPGEKDIHHLRTTVIEVLWEVPNNL